LLDRPFASLIYLGAGYARFSRPAKNAESTLFESELRVGLLGTHLGRWTQTEIHHFCCEDKPPRGWDNQIGDGGALTFRYSARWGQALAHGTWWRTKPYEVRISAGADVGYFTRGLGQVKLLLGGNYADIEDLRVGGIVEGHDPFVTDPVELQGMRGADTRIASASSGGRLDPTGLSFWLSYEISAFAYNQLLQGAWAGRNAVTVPRDQIETVVHHIGVGAELTNLLRLVGWATGRGTHIYFTQHRRSKDTKTPLGKVQAYGGFTIVWATD
jgi:hypothetical protein